MCSTISAAAIGRRDHRLPSENELVTALGVSRMTVHRALRELTSEGYLLRIQGVGTFVAPPKPQSALIEINNIASEIRRARQPPPRARSCSGKDNAADAGARSSPSNSRGADLSPIRSSSTSKTTCRSNSRSASSMPTLAPDYHRQDFASTTTYDYLTSRRHR